MIVKYPDDKLAEQCSDITDVELFAGSFKDSFNQMKYETEKDINAVAVAAPQIGVNKKAFYYDYRGKSGLVINPVIVNTSVDKNVAKEGCLSLPGYTFKVWRPSVIQVTFWNENGEFNREHLDGFLARIFQHEVDHLNGYLIPFFMTEEDFNNFEDHYFEGHDPKKFKCSAITIE